MSANAVTSWFGPRFTQLHPLLQALHRDGGTLRGVVEVATGRGLAGAIGRRIASALGIPVDRPTRNLEVFITHDAHSLTWTRRFDGRALMISVFEPVGAWPDGYWVERTRRVRVNVAVDVIDGGWHWRAVGIRVGHMPLPLWLFPRSSAYKRIEARRYAFCVSFALPLLGTVLRYGGTLDAVAGPEGGTS